MVAAGQGRAGHAILLVLDDFRGRAVVDELAVALRQLPRVGQASARLGSSYDQRQYRVAAAAGEVWLHPMGAVYIEGYGRLRNYYRDALDKLGVTVNLVRVAPTELRRDLSPKTRRRRPRCRPRACSTRDCGRPGRRRPRLPAGSPGAASTSCRSATTAAGGDLVKLALQAKWVDALKTRDEPRQAMIERGARDDGAKTFRQVSFDDYLSRLKPERSGEALAVVAEGGDQRRRVAAGRHRRAVHRGADPQGARGRRRRALVLRRLAWRQRRRADPPRAGADPRRRQTGRGVDGATLAASGGYRATAADEVIADASTVTGSIGVFTLLPTADQTLTSWACTPAASPPPGWARPDPRRAIDPRFRRGGAGQRGPPVRRLRGQGGCGAPAHAGADRRRGAGPCVDRAQALERAGRPAGQLPRCAGLVRAARQAGRRRRRLPHHLPGTRAWASAAPAGAVRRRRAGRPGRAPGRASDAALALPPVAQQMQLDLGLAGRCGAAAPAVHAGGALFAARRSQRMNLDLLGHGGRDWGVVAGVRGGLPGHVPGRAAAPEARRAGVALLGAIAVIAFTGESVEDAARAVDLLTIVFRLHGCCRRRCGWAALHRGDAACRRAAAVAQRAAGGADRRGRRALSAVFSNDVVCPAMTPVVAAPVACGGLNPLPFLIGLACAANIGSAATPHRQPAEHAHRLGDAAALCRPPADALPLVALSLLLLWLAESVPGPAGPMAVPAAEASPDDAEPPFDAFQSARGRGRGAAAHLPFTDWPREVAALVGAGVAAQPAAASGAGDGLLSTGSCCCCSSACSSSTMLKAPGWLPTPWLGWSPAACMCPTPACCWCWGGAVQPGVQRAGGDVVATAPAGEAAATTWRWSAPWPVTCCWWPDRQPDRR